jgi:hypothetical protein
MKPMCKEFQKSKFDFMTKRYKTKLVNGSIIFIKKGIWVHLGVQMGIKEKWWWWWNGYLKVN